MTQYINNIILWKNTLGLLPIDQFSGSTHKGKFILLNGGNGDLCIDIEPYEESKEFYFSSAWSSNIKNFVVTKTDKVLVYNWKKNDIEHYSVDKVLNNLVKFHSYLTNNSQRSEDDIIPFVISIFRKLRNLYNDKSNPLDSLNQLFLLLSSIDSIPENNSFWGIDDGIKPHPEFETYIKEFRNGISGKKPDLDLIFRHSLGMVFQEAQKEVLFFDKQMTLFSSGTLSDIYQTRKILYSSVHHTPSYLARCIVENALNDIDIENKCSLKILDPSCGSSEFLMEVLKQLKSRNYSGTIKIIGWDTSETAIKTSKFLLTYEKRNWNNRMDFTLRLVQDSLSESWENDYDLILMNPPFVSWEQLSKEARELVNTSLGNVFDGKPNQASAFFYKAILSLKSDGVIGTVLPSSILMLDAYKKLRNVVKEISTISLIGKLGNYVFEDALVDVSILIVRKIITKTLPIVIWTNNEKGIAIDALSEYRKMLYSNSPSVEKDNFSIYRQVNELIDSWKPISIEENNLFNKLLKLIKIGRLARVEDVFDVKQGVRTGNNQIFKIDTLRFHELPNQEKKFFKICIDNSSIKEGIIHECTYVWFPYSLKDGKLLITSEEQLKSEVPYFYAKYLENNKDGLSSRKKKIPFWWCLSDPAPRLLPLKKCILSTEFGKSDSFAFDVKGEYVIERGYGWIPKKEFKDTDDFYFYLAIFTSPFFDKLLSIYSKQLAGGNWFDLGKKFTKEIPLPKISDKFNLDDEHYCLNRESHIYKKMVQFGKDISNGEFYDQSNRNNLINEFIYPVH